ncbi:hypothetical protein LOB94_03765 [Lactobacillus delbrueckii subsp. bulgaricus]|uniref:hypothetical protein n=1 Tax=Lactobacillus delbrueckii TaxID=1584 RepID=UPI0004A5C755|nr:hypothetical protein [Lactobacillus delbrueckii]MCD5464849.1 hypothetical protein [Lactobacillus delbrueckii subsp. bulgaricus]MCD5482415.1 hypothetical protein [Lactobacillus delbrueckii subsp. bulgaricus]MCD5482467.1 hypothetical protein [Lactobacillus delbrueckii subsp. bulgaricus]CDR75505.1 Protein of unknown function [Lactobacillus delbrueckii subsp. bulgaricus]
MQISSENYIAVLTEQINALIVENMQLKAHILDMEAKAKEASDETKKKERRDDY